jgi:MatE
MAAPNALVMFAQLSIGLVEVYFVSRLGVDALAGVSLVFPVLSWIGAVSEGASSRPLHERSDEGTASEPTGWCGAPWRSPPRWVY